jgi:hypothetical protein
MLAIAARTDGGGQTPRAAFLRKQGMREGGNSEEKDWSLGAGFDSPHSYSPNGLEVELNVKN